MNVKSAQETFLCKIFVLVLKTNMIRETLHSCYRAS